MVKNEEYISFLKSLVACVSCGDYYSIKELSNLKLEIWKKYEQDIKKEIKNYKQKYKSIDELDNKELLKLMNLYSYYIIDKVKEQILSFEEFIEIIIK